DTGLQGRLTHRPITSSAVAGWSDREERPPGKGQLAPAQTEVQSKDRACAAVRAKHAESWRCSDPPSSFCRAGLRDAASNFAESKHIPSRARAGSLSSAATSALSRVKRRRARAELTGWPLGGARCEWNSCAETGARLALFECRILHRSTCNHAAHGVRL